jgi:hypothetical protein
MISIFNLAENEFDYRERHNDKLPFWFELTYKHYPDREKLWDLFDFFEINYPKWLRTFKMPQDYTEEELLMFVDATDKHYIANGCNFSDNLKFFQESITRCQGDLPTLLTAKETFASYVPWQFLFMNPLIKSERVFDRILSVIKAKKGQSEYYYRLHNYQKLSPPQMKELFLVMPSDERRQKGTEDFVRSMHHVIRDNPSIAHLYEDQMCNADTNSAFHYLNYPIDMQKKYIRSLNDQIGTRIMLINKMKISRDEKIAFIDELVRAVIV